MATKKELADKLYHERFIVAIEEKIKKNLNPQPSTNKKDKDKEEKIKEIIINFIMKSTAQEKKKLIEKSPEDVRIIIQQNMIKKDIDKVIMILTI